MSEKKFPQNWSPPAGFMMNLSTHHLFPFLSGLRHIKAKGVLRPTEPAGPSQYTPPSPPFPVCRESLCLLSLLTEPRAAETTPLEKTLCQGQLSSNFENSVGFIPCLAPVPWPL